MIMRDASAEAGDKVNPKPPHNLIRAISASPSLRSSEDDGMPTLYGHFSVFNRWTEIDSWFEGRFMERFAPGAFKKTIKENLARIKPLFQHGQDPQIGDKPLGPIQVLREDGDVGGYYEVPLLDTSYNRDLVPGLEAGLYGASFRFSVVREEEDKDPGRSDHNPDGIPERTIKEARLYEFGPVTFPAYADATAGVRSLTDHFVFDEIAREPERFRGLLAVDLSTYSRSLERDEPDDTEDAPSEETAPASATQSDERREPKPNKRFKNSEDWEAWLLNS